MLPGRRPPTAWPDSGSVDFVNYSTRYRPGLDLVIKGVTCHINGGEKVCSSYSGCSSCSSSSSSSSSRKGGGVWEGGEIDNLSVKHLSWCLQVCSSVYVIQLVFVCVCVCVCVCMCVCVWEREREIHYLLVWRLAGCIRCYEMIFFRSVYAYFSCADLCVHESDAELTSMCYS